MEYLFNPYIWAAIGLGFLVLEILIGTELIFPPLALTSGLMVAALNIFDFTSISQILYVSSALAVVSIIPFWLLKKHNDTPEDINKY